MKSLEEYAALFEKLGLTELTVVDGDQKICLKKQPAPAAPGLTAPEQTQAPVSVPPAAGAGTQPPAGAEARSAVPANAGPAARTGEVVRSPLLGVFYARVNGEARRLGEQVRKGDVLCTIEAMKMMNEVTAPADGTITEILATDGALVEYNQELFVIG
jgi:acetyl-CoA carboxylase biotin carboxyl carrier protein